MSAADLGTVPAVATLPRGAPQETAPPGRPSFVPALEGLRGAAALWVVAYHCWIRTGSGPLDDGPVQATVASGTIGVDLFFVLSGCVLLLRPLQRRTLGGARTFLFRRAARLYPAAWLSLGVVVVAAPWIVADRSLIDRTITPESVVANVSLLGGVGRLVPGYEGAIGFAGNPVLWSLTPELLFSLALVALVPLLVRRPLVVVAALLITGVLVRRLDPSSQLLSVVGPLTTDFPVGIVAALAIVYAASRTSAGTGVGTAPAEPAGSSSLAGPAAPTPRRRARPSGRAGPWLAPVGLLALAAIVLTRDGGDARALKLALTHGDRLPLLIAGATGLLVACLALAPRAPLSRLLASRPLRALGRWSYGIYLFHFPIIGLLLWTVGLRHDGSSGAFVAALLAAVPLSVLAGAASHRLLEEPVRRWAADRTRRADPTPSVLRPVSHRQEPPCPLPRP